MKIGIFPLVLVAAALQTSFAQDMSLPCEVKLGAPPKWKPGELELHFIYTGCGENMFYRLPDGTTILNDCGEFYRPKNDVPELIPLLPPKDRLGGDRVAQYIKQVYDGDTIDYVVFSHWHADHIGHSTVAEDTPEKAYRFRTTADGRMISGFLCVAEDFDIKRAFVHQYELDGKYGQIDTSINAFRDWIARRGEKTEFRKFNVGAIDQIKMVRDPKPYEGLFSVRNLAANGVVWDGKDGTIDFVARHLAAVGEKTISQNMMSMAFVMQYGKFKYLSLGDLERTELKWRGNSAECVDGFIGGLVGPVSVCKLAHHGNANGSSEEFLRAVNAQTYVACMWCPVQCNPKTMTRIRKIAAENGAKPDIFPQVALPGHLEWARQNDARIPYSGPVHIVIKVAPRGESYEVYLTELKSSR